MALWEIGQVLLAFLYVVVLMKNKPTCSNFYRVWITFTTCFELRLLLTSKLPITCKTGENCRSLAVADLPCNSPSPDCAPISSVSRVLPRYVTAEHWVGHGTMLLHSKLHKFLLLHHFGAAKTNAFPSEGCRSPIRSWKRNPAHFNTDQSFQTTLVENDVRDKKESMVG